MVSKFTDAKGDFNFTSIFHAALGEEDWASVLRHFSQAVDSAVFLVLPDPNQRGGMFPLAHRYDLGVFDNGLFSMEDQWNPSINPLIGPIFATKSATGIDRRSLISDTESQRNEFLRIVGSANGVDYLRLSNLASTETGPAGVWIGRSKQAGPVEGENARLFDTSLRHFMLALRTRGRLLEGGSVKKSLQSAIDRLHQGFVAVDVDLKIIFRNAAADTIFSAEDGVTEHRGRLRISSGRDQRAIEACVRSLQKGQIDATAHRFPIQRQSRLPDYSLTVSPSDGLRDGVGAQRSSAAIFIADPLNPKEPHDAATLATTYGISLAEARAARLVGLGLTKREIGERLGLSENTIRTQLASAREKLGANSLPHLVFLLS